MNPDINFSTVLASSVHDMKNSLALVLQQLEEVSAQTQGSAVGSKVAQLHYEAQRINANLVQLLHLYRHQQQQTVVNIELHFIDEIIEELVLNNEFYLQQKGIELSLQVEQPCMAYCDRDLISNLLNDIIVNAMRYTADKLEIVASQQADQQVLIEVSDNGPGYPAAMLAAASNKASPLCADYSRTGLGLYFARQIAASHQRAGKKGQITLKNGGNLGGSVFKLVLP